MDQSPKVKAELKPPAFWTVDLEAVRGGNSLSPTQWLKLQMAYTKQGTEPRQGWGTAPPYRNDKNASIDHCLGLRYIPIKLRKSKHSLAVRIWLVYQGTH